MSPRTDKVVSEALDLPREDRAFIAEKLLESLDFGEAFPISPEWKEEIARRSREIEERKVELIPAEQVFRDARERYG